MSNVSSPEMMQRVPFWTAQMPAEIGAVGVYVPGPLALPGLCRKAHLFHAFYTLKKKQKTTSNPFHIRHFTQSRVSAIAFLFICEHIFALSKHHTHPINVLIHTRCSFLSDLDQSTMFEEEIHSLFCQFWGMFSNVMQILLLKYYKERCYFRVH